MKKKKKMKIPDYVILEWPDMRIKYLIESEEDLEAVKVIAENDGYKIKYPPLEESTNE